MISIFEEHNVAYANWNYKSNAFGVVDNNGDPFSLISTLCWERIAFKVLSF